jgi:hypothetical protein
MRKVLNLPSSGQRKMSLGIFVNTSDGFQDCWGPFFSLFRQYGDTLRALPIYLNTERAEIGGGSGEICCTKVWAETEETRPTWSQCLCRGLDKMREDHVLYLQEDYFFKRTIPGDLMLEAVRVLEEDSRVGVVYLTRYGPRIRKSRPYSGRFLEICPPADYLINTQAAIWDRKFLRSLIREWENGWMFEKFGSLRALRSERRFLSLTADAMKENQFVDYVWTGVMKGKWNTECVELFREHGIDVDFEGRGFYREGSRLKSRFEVLQKLFGRPAPALRSIFDLVKGSGAESASRT